MDRLSSCYFCGTALDEPLQEYPLVAGDTGEHGAVVTLCPGCHHKLETVLGVVVGESEDLPALEDADRAALEGESPAALTEPEGENAGAGEGAPDPIALGDGERDDGEVGDADSTADAAGEPPATGTDSGGNADGDTSAETPETVDGTGSGVESAATESADEATDAGTDGDGPAEGAEPPGDGGSDAGTDGTPTDAATARGTAGEGGGTDPDREVTATVSALEYNKVMRLLQNREFPVDRAEIEAVATSAYELSGSECAAVIDLAVDRGLVVERDGQLVRPDG